MAPCSRSAPRPSSTWWQTWSAARRDCGNDNAVLIAIFTDIHGNREALEACLAHARRHPIDRYVFLGDYVGYGADPGFVVDMVKDHAARGAITLLGNHDSAAIGAPERMNDQAMLAIEWTRRQT